MCPKKWKRLINHRTKSFYSIIKFSFDSNRKHSNLDVETKFTRIGYVFTEVRQFQN